jgi:hypothetical protein
LSLNELLQTLSAVDQEKHKSEIKSLSYIQSKFYWILNDVDFKQWSNATCSQVLWLSAPPKCSIDQISSYVVDMEKEKASETQHSILYFFCSTANTENPIVVSFIHSILYQIISCSSSNEKAPIVRNFLHSLLSAIPRNDQASNTKLRHFGEGDCPSATIKNMLDANANGLWSALRAVLDDEHARKLSIVIDGLDKAKHQKVEFVRKIRELIEYLQGRASEAKVLLTSQPEAEIKEVLDGLPCIEYDKERKGSVTPRGSDSKLSSPY